MENKCKIVIDLLPNYIENLTSEDTNKFIEEHIETCKECKKVYTEMNSDIKEDIENTEIVKKIKTYKRKTLTIKLIVLIVLLCILLPIIKNLSFKYYVVSNVLEKNLDYDIGNNYRIEEYIESIERYENHITTYYLEGKMKKVYGDKLLEYYDGKNHYYFDDDKKTYYVEKDVPLNDNLNININIFENSNFKDNFISKIKFILDKDITIQKRGFRDEEYYYIYEKNDTSTEIYFDENTFFAQRIVNEKSDEYKPEERREYRITSSVVNYRLVEVPDFSLYTQVENEGGVTNEN